MNKFCRVFAAAALSAAAGTSGIAAETCLNGCKIVPVELSVVTTSPEHLNFCYAFRYPDNVIHLNYAVGIHTVQATGRANISTDNGKTWTAERMPGGAAGRNSFYSKDGKRIQLSGQEGKILKKHKINIRVFDDATGKFNDKSSEIEFPHACSLMLHRDVIRTRDDRLLATDYGRKEGAKNFHINLLESTDDGRSWHYLSTVAEDKENRYPEGPDEATLVELADGSILSIFRVGGYVPAMQCRSTDGGKTWGEIEKSIGHGASPNAKLLSDGTLAVVSGRPGVYLYLDLTGTGKEYQRYAVYTASSSSYATVLETAPGEITVIYDESDFGTGRNPSAFSRIMAARYRIEKGDFRFSSDDPRGKGYTIFYSPAQRKRPDQLKIAYPQGYKGKPGQGINWVDVVDIPERPYPVLRMVSHGDGKSDEGFARSKYRCQLVPEDVEKVEIGFEFRLGEADIKLPQFMVAGTVAAGKDEKASGYVGFAVDRIRYFENGKRKELKCEIGTTKFHAFRMVIDGPAKQWRLYRQGEDKPLLTVATTPANVSEISWGDGGTSDVFGSADLSYIGIKY